ncbi:MAG: hypothetical protein AAFY28_22100, partial [Actinomycetota bacterium]
VAASHPAVAGQSGGSCVDAPHRHEAPGWRWLARLGVMAESLGMDEIADDLLVVVEALGRAGINTVASEVMLDQHAPEVVRQRALDRASLLLTAERIAR